MSTSILFISVLAIIAWYLLFTIMRGAYLHTCADKHSSLEEKLFNYISEPPKMDV